MISLITLKSMKDFLKILLLAAVLSNPVFASGGKLTGKITEKQTGTPVTYANVMLTHRIQQDREVSLQMPIGAVTDNEGYYVILNIPPGEYTVKASMVGYASIIVKEVKIDPDRTFSLNFEFEPASVELGEITVTAEKEVIKRDVSGTQEIISADRLETLPIVRVDDYLGKLKGIVLTTSSDGYGLIIRGGGIRETDIRMDGISLQDPRSGNSYLGFNSTTIDEIQVITGGFEAKFGGIRSGLLDVKTKDGSRERFTASVRTTYTPEGQYRFFGTNPYSNESWIYRIYAGEYAWTGVVDSLVPVDLQGFRGWNKTTSPTEMKALDSLQKLELWKLQHPQYGVARRPDYIVEGTFTGPLPIPYTSFMAAFKYENSQFVYPIGPRDDYVDWNGQLKFTTTLEKMKFSVNGMYAKILSNTSAQSVSYDASQRFAYMNNNNVDAVNRQAALVAGQSGLLNLFNKSRLQEFEQTYVMGGAKFTHVPTPKIFYTVDFQLGYTGQDITPMLMNMSLDSSQNYYYFYSTAAKRYYQFFSPTAGLPNGSTNPTSDGMKKFNMYGGHQWADSSYSYNFQLKGDMTWQANRFNQVQAGFSASLQKITVYAGSWNQSALAFTPNSWQYFKGSPLDIGLYVQDKMEFEGMILNAGLRLDYFNPLKDRYEVDPEDKDYAKFYTTIYSGLDGDYNSYERWLLFREYLENPPGWPTSENGAQMRLSPRLGVSFPITESSKMYFNFGHFYQRPAASILYNMKLDAGSTVIPTPDLPVARTVSYEFGYEQTFLENFLFNVTAYYKDISNEPLSRIYFDWYETNRIVKYYPDSYRDIKGVELRLERNYGKYVTFSAMYDYMITSSGQAGYSAIYENLVTRRENDLRSAVQYTPKALPRANINLNLHTPGEFGHFLGNWFANVFFEWKDGGDVLLNEDQTIITLQEWIERVNYWNIDFKLSKQVNVINSSFEISLIVKNLTNNKWLYTANMTQAEVSAYKNALKDKGGKYGEYKPEHLAKVFANSWENVLFLNPRRIILAISVNL